MSLIKKLARNTVLLQDFLPINNWNGDFRFNLIVIGMPIGIWYNCLLHRLNVFKGYYVVKEKTCHYPCENCDVRNKSQLDNKFIIWYVIQIDFSSNIQKIELRLTIHFSWLNWPLGAYSPEKLVPSACKMCQCSFIDWML